MGQLAAGRELAGRFRLQRLLGRGGTAEVWAATDQTTGTEIGLRIVSAPDENAAALLLATYRRDAERLRGLVHPGILRPLEVLIDGNLVCVVLELADRGNLGSLRGAGYQTIVNAMRDVADALQYVHAQGLTHGDLKAGNVLRDAQGRWRLTDFRSSDSSAGNSAVSLSTVSPQQLDGAPPTVADDIYSLGAVLHDLLAGHPPLHPAITRDPYPFRGAGSPRGGRPGADRAGRIGATGCRHARKITRPATRQPWRCPRPAGGNCHRGASPAGVGHLPPTSPLTDCGRVAWPRPASGRPPVLVVAGLLVLLAGIVAVVFWLPRVVSERGPLVAPRPAIAPALPGPDKPVAPDARAAADDALALRLRAEDAARGAAADRWGGADWLEARRLADLGDNQYRGRDFEAATGELHAGNRTFPATRRRVHPRRSPPRWRKGKEAFERADQPVAVAAFERAMLISPADATAKRGLARSQVLDEVLRGMAEAAAQEADGRPGGGPRRLCRRARTRSRLGTGPRRCRATRCDPCRRRI